MARNLGQKTERRILKKIGAKKQPMSGAISGFPNDGVKGRYLLEIKSTERKSLGIKSIWLWELDENAVSRNKIPALIMVFNHGETLQTQWVAIPMRDFERLTKNWAKS